MSKDVTVVCYAHNGLAYLKDFLGTMSKLPEFIGIRKVFLSDMESDGTAKYVEENGKDWEVQKVTFDSVTGMMNCASDICDTKYMMLCNEDLVLNEPFLEKCLESFKHGKVGAVGPKMINYWTGRIASVGHADPTVLHWIIDRGVNEEDVGQYDSVREEIGLCGGCVIWDVDVFKLIGGVDDRYVYYFEDADIALRARMAGYKMINDGRVRVWHKLGYENYEQTKGRKDIETLSFWCDRNRMLYLARHYPEELWKAMFCSYSHNSGRYLTIADNLSEVGDYVRLYHRGKYAAFADLCTIWLQTVMQFGLPTMDKKELIERTQRHEPPFKNLRLRKISQAKWYIDRLKKGGAREEMKAKPAVKEVRDVEKVAKDAPQI